MIVSFPVHCGGVQSQNNENCVNVPIYMDLTVRVKMSLQYLCPASADPAMQIETTS